MSLKSHFAVPLYIAQEAVSVERGRVEAGAERGTETGGEIATVGGTATGRETEIGKESDRGLGREGEREEVEAGAAAGGHTVCSDS